MADRPSALFCLKRVNKYAFIISQQFSLYNLNYNLIFKKLIKKYLIENLNFFSMYAS